MKLKFQQPLAQQYKHQPNHSEPIMRNQGMEQSLIDRVLQLSPPDRMRLLNVIYTSLEQPNEVIDQIWYNEAERRLAAFESGTVKGIPVEEVLGKRA